LIRNEPVALLFGAGLAATILLSLTVSVIRRIRLGGLAFALPRLPVEVEAADPTADPTADATADTTEVTLPCPPIVRDPARRRRSARERAHQPTGALPPGVWSLDLAAGDRTCRLTAGWARGASQPAAFRGGNPGRGLYRIAAAELVVPDPFALVQLRFRGQPPVPAGGADPADGVPPPVLRVLPRVDSRGIDAAEPEIAAGRRRGDLSNERNEELIETRPYHPGDDIRRINWNAFAHSGELFLRIGEETPPPAWAVRLMVDTRGASDADRLDTLLAAALGVAEGLATSGVVHLSLRTPVHPELELGGILRARRVLAAVDATEGLLAGYEVGVRDDDAERSGGPGGTPSEAAIVVAFDGTTGEVTLRQRRRGGA
jgi:hypothetical protein